MRRVISVWLPRWPIDRLRRARRLATLSPNGPSAEPVPFALTAPGRHGAVLAAVNRQAEAGGLVPGMRLADARALLPRLTTAGSSPEEDRCGLERLALWCRRFTPSSAVDGVDGLLLDITGCAHLFGGEAAMTMEVETRLAGLGFETRAGLADTPAAAWALARFGDEGRRLAEPGRAAAALAPLPVEALRLASEDTRMLRRLGLASVGAVETLPRVALARRFARHSGAVLHRLDCALGRRSDPVAPLPPPPVCLARLAFPEPLTDPAALEAVLARLLGDLCASLEQKGLGVRDLVLLLFRVDGGTVRHRVSTVRVTRDGAHLGGLFAGKIGTVDPGFGIDVAVLHVVRTEPLAPEQYRLTADELEERGGSGALAHLIDRLQARLGRGSVFRLEPLASHLPECAERRMDPGREGVMRPAQPGVPQRPLRLFDRPEPVDAVAQVPDGPPALFTWRRLRRRIVRAEGPERIEPEWWAGGPQERPRDYYRVEDQDGRRYWLFRAGLYRDTGGKGTPRWYIHGLYG